MIALLIFWQIFSATVGFSQTEKAAPFSGFRCDGTAEGERCELTFYFNSCKSSFRLFWPKLEMPGSKKWNEAKANWCTLEWSENGKAFSSVKRQNSSCRKIVDLFADLLRNFPEEPVQQSACSLLNPKDALVVARRSKGETKSVTVPQAGECFFSKRGIKKFHLQCPYMSDRTEHWLKELAIHAKVSVVFFNPGKTGPVSTSPPSRNLR